MLVGVRGVLGVVTVALFTPVTRTSSSSSVRSMTEPFGRAGGAATLDGVLPVAWLSVFVVSDVPWGGPGAADPVAAGPDVTGDEVEERAPATETDCVGALTVATETPALGVVIAPAPPWYTARAREIWEVGTGAAEAWRAGTVAAVKVLGTTEEDVGADLRIKVVGAVVFALFKEVAAFKEETGMLTSVPV